MKKSIVFIILLCFTLLSSSLFVSGANASSGYIASNDKNSSFSEEKVITKINRTVIDQPVSFNVTVLHDGLYTVGMSYKAIDDGIDDIEIMLLVDDELPFKDTEKLSFPRMWVDSAQNRVDGMGNEFAPEKTPYDSFYYNEAIDVTKWTADKYLINLTAGEHTIVISPVSGSFELDYFAFGVPETSVPYKSPSSNDEFYDGSPIVMEAEKPLLKNSYWISSKDDNSSVLVTPNSAKNTVVNYMDGGNWQTSGDTIIWETPELKAGYYNLGLNFRQKSVIGGKIYRRLTIDGKVPFSEAESIGFGYDDNWQQYVYSDGNNNPYNIYLSAGKHRIAFTVIPGEMADIRNQLRDVVSEMGTLYIKINMITGETVDAYRDYDLFKQIPDMQKRLEKIFNTLKEIDSQLVKITGQNSGSYSAVIKNTMRAVEQMLDNKYTAHRYKDNYYSSYTSLGSVLFELRNMPLDLDKLVLMSPGDKYAFKEANIFKSIWFSVEKFFVSFVNNYNNISGNSDDKEQVTVWVNWGVDQARVLNSLAQNKFTATTKIPVNVKLVNASVVQAILSGKGPDCLLQTARTEPVNLAMRGVLYDLNNFDDISDVLGRFQKSAAVPYYYKGGLYGLPDTQTFYVMFYRKDILEQMGLDVPETWGDFKRVCKQLTRNNLTVWLPNTEIFNTMLLQKGLSLYENDGRRTNLSDSEVIVTFGETTDFFRKLKLPLTLDFYNRFRTGTCPIGISTYTLYTTLKVAAPEIDGLWGVTSVPGVEQEDGTVSRISCGGGTACSILNLSNNKKNAWEFIKWWTEKDTQLSFSNEVEAILGPSGRIAVANVEALKNMSWDEGMIEPIIEAWNHVEEIPEYPGSYYVSRSVYQGFWNVINDNENPKDMLLKFGKEADDEMIRKWKQYENR